jgi:hypothetical protein
MSENYAPRRWFQFSLRMAFVDLTILCCFLGYQLNWIRQRRTAIKDCKSFREDVAPHAAPGLLWLFGEPGYEEIQPRYYTANWYPLFGPAAAEEHRLERKRIRAIFPEVETIEMDLHPPKLDHATAEARIEQIGGRLAGIASNQVNVSPQERHRLTAERRKLEQQLGRPVTDPLPHE